MPVATILAGRAQPEKPQSAAAEYHDAVCAYAECAYAECAYAV
jgi:hypothetical protein